MIAEPEFRFMGPKQINDFAMLGTMIPAAEAKRLGIVNRVVPREKLDEAAMQMANILLLKNPWALARIKWLNHRMELLSINDGAELSHDQGAIWLQLPDVKEGISAFLEKRKANYEQFKGKIQHVPRYQR
jgi:enoyl-CoA hydratase/carnithine racemase